MAIKLNQKGYKYAVSLIKAGKVDKESSWSISAEEENQILGDPPDWSRYSLYFLGEDTSASEETKARWKYPFGKGGKVYRSALTAIRQRSAQQNEQDIFEAAGRLLEQIDAKESKFLVMKGQEVSGVPPEVQIHPFGEVSHPRGRYEFTREMAEKIVENFKKLKKDVVIDYEHQTLSGDTAPAAGWIKELGVREDGLYGKVSWTPNAEKYLLLREYRYLSPVLLLSSRDPQTGEKIGPVLHSVALTNAPFLTWQKPIVNKRKGGEEEMLKKLMEKLAVEKEDEVMAKVEELIALKERADSFVAHKEVLSLLELEESASLEDVKAKVIELKNPSGYVPRQEFEGLKKQLAMKEVEEAVSQAIQEGKILPAQEEWAKEYALKDLAGFKAFVEKAPVIVPLGEVSGRATVKKEGTLDETQVRINKLLGIDEETWKKHNQKEGGE